MLEVAVAVEFERACRCSSFVRQAVLRKNESKIRFKFGRFTAATKETERETDTQTRRQRERGGTGVDQNRLSEDQSTLD